MIALNKYLSAKSVDFVENLSILAKPGIHPQPVDNFKGTDPLGWNL